ncbi:cation:proton antiporter [Thermodesulforhabdus norvegica]|uniref:Monovalent cation:H+ antiporter-2, CPA2 family n=1 Tax=Thermodesulforhabdus norvegica TaxID=39841 RepID=A0A1I4VU00_9BACT|nr:cation:proton antiporter [Thermodesulforhabdus norvegica]SFN04519.1 monovalent cation:H+ antiporter-2, CPA2 family [Thermodesulforhabdus norvegica]
MQEGIIAYVSLLFGLSVLVLMLCHKLKIPVLVGLIITGLIAGPYGLGIVHRGHEVEVLAEIGVILLLFSIGLEFSMKELFRIKRFVFIGGLLQVIITTGLAYGASVVLGIPGHRSLVLGLLISLSSTAIVVKELERKGELHTPHGRVVLGMLIFQDLSIVPIMLTIPLLAGDGLAPAALATNTIKGILIVAVALIGAKWVVPSLLFQITRTRIRELFLLSVITVCMGISWATAQVGLSFALGAFLAGLVLSESEYARQALGNIIPFRDVFTTFFFVSIGMLMDTSLLVQKPAFVLLGIAGVLTLKATAACTAALLLGMPIRTAVIAALALSQIGEFSFVLAGSAFSEGILGKNEYNLFLLVSIMTMILSPFLLEFAPRLGYSIARLPMPSKIRQGYYAKSRLEKDPKNHLVIIGFGITGRHMAQACRVFKIPYAVLEMNPETVRTERERGEPIFYGDATHESSLEQVHVREAKAVVVAINDPTATRRIVELLKKLRRELQVIVRTRYLQEVEELRRLGADEVIVEELETSLAMFARVLNKFLVPLNEIERLVVMLGSDGYRMMREDDYAGKIVTQLKPFTVDLEVMSFRVEEGSSFDGATLAQLELRKKYGVSAVAVRRGNNLFANPSPDMEIRAGDLVVLLGSPLDIMKARGLFLSNPQKEGEEGSNPVAGSE